MGVWLQAVHLHSITQLSQSQYIHVILLLSTNFGGEWEGGEGGIKVRYLSVGGNQYILYTYNIYLVM